MREPARHPPRLQRVASRANFTKKHSTASFRSEEKWWEATKLRPGLPAESSATVFDHLPKPCLELLSNPLWDDARDNF
jgi:hypothetical protein